MDIDKIGEIVIGILVKAGYYVCLAVVIKDILSCISKRDIEGIIKASVGGLIGYAAIKYADNLLDLVK